ncbi:translation initiation factor 2 [Hansschlegelia quercus]|uniref:Translation initiation factor 2 n=1 Tax=Hansschlegelia quercus TaxID=2528245 RepID=A0A4Q9GQV5_9HYPH|nr:translation initiation factor 2 [Hansschlegelia quercus]TBN54440.1 translation initiation factor 2 [Hansschlegelia quercus]
MKLVVALAACAALSGCASITRGSTEQLTVTTTPSEATVRTSMNHQCTSPCTLTVGRKDEFIVTATKPGFKEASVPVKTKVAGNGGAAFAGNVLVGGLIGMGVDASTGAALDHYPNPVVLALEPIAAIPAPKPERRGKQAAKPVS